MGFVYEQQTAQKNRRIRWMISYSDFTTVLLALFMVLTVSANTKLKEVEKELGIKDTENVKIEDSKPKEIKEEGNPDKGVNLLLQGVKNPSQSKEISVIEFEKVAKELGNTEGIEIIEETGGITIRMGESLLFDSASSDIKPVSKKTLDKIANVLTKNQKQIRIEGHTDNIPIKNTKYESNWELSSARAAKIANYLISEKKINKNRFVISGYADVKPISKNSTAEGRSKNRRVDIILVN